jgi:hypothetical protein
MKELSLLSRAVPAAELCRLPLHPYLSTFDRFEVDSAKQRILLQVCVCFRAPIWFLPRYMRGARSSRVRDECLSSKRATAGFNLAAFAALVWSRRLAHGKAAPLLLFSPGACDTSYILHLFRPAEC